MTNIRRSRVQAREEVVKISSGRGFGLASPGFFALLGALSVYNVGERWHYWFALAALFAVMAYVVLCALAPLNRLWAKFGLLLHTKRSRTNSERGQ